ncbi:MAG: FAD-dependent oxidoreductase [Bacteroidota bacterium]
MKQKYKVIIIGGGPAGIGTAIKLNKSGIRPVVVIERNQSIGGIPSYYKRKKGGVRTFMRWSRGGIPVFGEDYAAWLKRRITDTDVEIKLESHVIEINAKQKEVTWVSPGEGKVTASAQAVVFATGGREKTIPERKWIAGARGSRVMFTKQLLALSALHNVHPVNRPLIIGSDVIAYAAAAKLRTGGAQNATIADNKTSPDTPFHERLYFRLFCKPSFRRGDTGSAEIKGNLAANGVRISDRFTDADGVIISGQLIPNSELALMGNLKVDIPSRIPVLDDHYQLSEQGWFATGNVTGGFHGAEWCYYNGKRVANPVIKYISKHKLPATTKNQADAI